MRSRLVALTLPLLSLGACGGAGTSGVPAGFGAPPPAAEPGPTAPPVTTTPNQKNLFDVTAEARFDTLSATQSLNIDDKGGQLYRGNATTVAAPGGTITYDPRDGIFNLVVSDEKSGVSRTIRFQDPGHRADADGARNGALEVPLLPGFNYMQVKDGEGIFTFFYQRPGTSGSFVSLAGFSRNEVPDPKTMQPGDLTLKAEQGVFVFGTRTSVGQTPERGTGQYDGQFLASMVGQRNGSDSVLQWINGTSSVAVDFGARSIALSLNGTVGPAVNSRPGAPSFVSVMSGTGFTATGSATWAQGGNAFAGRFTSAGFGSGASATPIDFTSVSAGTSVAGASSIDGTFYGPNAGQVGGNFRITGGVPNQRVDILGGFTGTKK